LKIWDRIYSGSLKNFKHSIQNSYALPLYLINLFSIINNIELYPYSGSSLSRSAGSSALLVGKKKKKIILKLKSGWFVYLNRFCIASLGYASNVLFKFKNLKKAGVNINLGKKPVVRGVAMNPCDHPHGGGEGKKSPPSSKKSPWGWNTSGGSSSNNKKYQILNKKKFKSIR